MAQKKRKVGNPKKNAPEKVGGETGEERKTRIIQRVWTIAEPICESEGLELVFVEYQAETHGKILRIYIDKPGGVTLDDCVGVTRQISDILDISLEDVGGYKLEVSSPGPERPLGKRSDYERFSGRRVQINIASPLDGRKRFQGTLRGITDGRVAVELDQETIMIPMEQIVRARLAEDHGEK